jgi:FkbM family methyltransferase
MIPDINFDLLFRALFENRPLHSCGGPTYQVCRAAAAALLENLGLRNAVPSPFPFGPFGELKFPYHAMGTKDTLDLFGLDELIIFAFYWANRNRYHNTLDIGANAGLHSVIMARCGFTVTAFEPDPRHFGWLAENLQLNECATVKPVQAAVSDHEGELEFVRVLGNTTGSHLAGAKNPYGELERFPVRVENFASYVSDAELVKIDAEGHEPEILFAALPGAWVRCDAIIEVGSEKNAERIFEHFRGTGVNLFAQKIGWNRVNQLDQVPTSHREGSLFISRQSEMPWGA